MKHLILAVQIIGNDIVAFRTTKDIVISYSALILDISLNGTTYVIRSGNIEEKIEIDSNEMVIKKPSLEVFMTLPRI